MIVNPNFVIKNDCKIEYKDLGLLDSACKATDLKNKMGIYLMPENYIKKNYLAFRKDKNNNNFKNIFKIIDSDDINDKDFKKCLKQMIDKLFKDYDNDSTDDSENYIISFTNIPYYLAYHVLQPPFISEEEKSTDYMNLKNSYIEFSDEKEYDERAKNLIRLFSDVFNSGKEHFLKQGMSKKEAESTAFDVARGFLPMGARTTVILNVTFEQLFEKYRYLNSLSNDFFPFANELKKLLFYIIYIDLRESFETMRENKDSLKDCKIESYEKELKFMKFCQISQQTKDGSFKDSLRKLKMHLDLSKFANEFSYSELSYLIEPFVGHMNLSFAESRELSCYRELLKNLFNFENILNNELHSFYAEYLEKFEDNNLNQRVKDHYQWLKDNADNDSRKEIIRCVPMGTVSNHMIIGTLDQWNTFLNIGNDDKVHPALAEALSSIGNELNSSLKKFDIPISMPVVDTDCSHGSKDE